MEYDLLEVVHISGVCINWRGEMWILARGLHSEMAPQPHPQRPVEYIPLANVPPVGTINVIGMCTEYSVPKPTRGTDFLSRFELIDSSVQNITDAFRCSFFCRETQNVPALSVGDVITIHRLQTQPFNDRVEGKRHFTTTFRIFSCQECEQAFGDGTTAAASTDQEAPIVFNQGTSLDSLTDTERERCRSTYFHGRRLLSSENRMSSQYMCSLADVDQYGRDYADITAQVLSIALPPQLDPNVAAQSPLYVAVRDGSVFASHKQRLWTALEGKGYEFRGLSATELDDYECEIECPNAQPSMNTNAYNGCIEDAEISLASSSYTPQMAYTDLQHICLFPSDALHLYAYLRNMSANVFVKFRNVYRKPQTHLGESYTRSRKFELQLSSQTQLMILPKWHYNANLVFRRCMRFGWCRCRYHSAIREQERVEEARRAEVLDERPVKIIGHQRQPITSLLDVKNYPDDIGLFRVRCMVQAIEPANVVDICSPICPHCPESRMERCRSGTGFECPTCAHKTDSPEYQYFVRLQIYDDSDTTLPVLIARKPAETFFHDIPPVDLRKNSVSSKLLHEKLRVLLHPYVWIEMCIFSYVSDHSAERVYQIFDTVLT